MVVSAADISDVAVVADSIANGTMVESCLVVAIIEIEASVLDVVCSEMT
jgi:hypothetical protein